MTYARAVETHVRDTATRARDVRERALVIDLDSSARRELEHELRNRGFDVCASDSANEALAIAASVRPSLIVLELQLRSGWRFDLLARLRSELPSAKLVVLTSYGSVASAVRALRCGATNYLCKPARAAEVLWAASDSGDETADGRTEGTHERAANDSLTLDQAIWEYIHQTLEISGSISEAARRLGLFRQSLKRMISKYRPGDATGALSMRSAGTRP
jgi:two-component system response regulator RegA